MAVLAGLGLAGCGDSAAGAQTRVRVLVRDINLRAVGGECAGTGGYAHLHRRADYRVTDGAGTTLARGELPAGVAVASFDEDLEVAKVPTYCEFAVSVRVPPRDAYQLVVGGGRPIALTVNTAHGPALVAVVPK